MNQFNIFFYCHIARCIWGCVQVTFNIPPPTSINHVFDGWLQGVDMQLKNKIWFGACTICWAIWLCRNDMIFNNALVPTPMQVTFRGTYWMRQWVLLLKEDARAQVRLWCRQLELTIVKPKICIREK
jgi:hypothetical protein